MPIFVNERIEIPDYEYWFTTSRAGGPGGQHVNRTESRVTIHWVPDRSGVLTPHQKVLIKRRLSNRLTLEGELQLHVQDERSQHRNRTIAEQRLATIVVGALRIQKKRRKTRPTRGSIKRRLESKKQTSEKKKQRQKPTLD